MQEFAPSLSSPPCEHTVKVRPSANQEGDPGQTLDVPAPWSGTSQPPELVGWLSHLSLSSQPKLRQPTICLALVWAPGRTEMQWLPRAWLSWSITAVSILIGQSSFLTGCYMDSTIPDARGIKVNRIRFCLWGIFVCFNDFQETALPSNLSYSNLGCQSKQ